MELLLVLQLHPYLVFFIQCFFITAAPLQAARAGSGPVKLSAFSLQPRPAPSPLGWRICSRQNSDLPTRRGDDGGGCGQRRSPGKHFPVGTGPSRRIRRCQGAWRPRPSSDEPVCDLGDRPVLSELRPQVRGFVFGQRGVTDTARGGWCCHRVQYGEETLCVCVCVCVCVRKREQFLCKIKFYFTFYFLFYCCCCQ